MSDGATDAAGAPAGPAARRAGGGVVAAWVRLTVLALIGVAQTPVLFACLPPDALGVWYLFFTLATFISLSDFGLPSTLLRAVAFLWGHGMRRDGGTGSGLPKLYEGVSLGELYASAFAATALLGLAFAAVAVPGALAYFGRVLPDGPLRASILAPLALFLAGVFLNVVAAIPAACLSGSGDVTWDNATRTAASVVGFGLVVTLLPRHRSLEVLCAIYALQGAIALALAHAALRRRHPAATRLSALRPRLALVRGMYRESTPLFASRIGTWLTAESTLLVGGYFLGSGRIADYGVLRQLVGIGASVTTAIPNATSPHTAAAHAAGDRSKVQSMFLATLRYAGIVNLLWTAGLLLWAPPVLVLLAGPGHFLGYAVLVPVALASLAEVHASTHGAFTWTVGRWPFTPHILGGGILNVALTSAGAAALGFAGLAWGGVAAQAPTVWVAQVRHAVRAAGRPPGYSREFLRPAAAYALALAVSGLAIRAGVGELAGGTLAARGPLQLAWTLAGVGATTAAAALLAWRLALTPDDRAYLLGFARRGR